MVKPEKLLLHAALAATRSEWRKARRFMEELLEKSGGEVLELLPEWARRNEAEILTHRLCLESGTRLGERAAEKLRPLVEDTLERAEAMARLIEEMDRALTPAGIEYTVFKTINRLGRVDVDVDTIIPPNRYWEAVKRLWERGFKPVDDVKKTYATGFMLPGNPIVLDLHTELTVLGIPYIDNTILLGSAERRTTTLPGGHTVETNVANPLADTVARIGHALIKEAELKLDDITETLPTLEEQSHLVARILEEQGIREAHHYYLEAIARAIGSGETPLRLARDKSIELLLRRLLRRNRPDMLLRALGNLRYKRNAAHIGKLFIATKLQ